MNHNSCSSVGLSGMWRGTLFVRIVRVDGSRQGHTRPSPSASGAFWRNRVIVRDEFELARSSAGGVGGLILAYLSNEPFEGIEITVDAGVPDIRNGIELAEARQGGISDDGGGNLGFAELPKVLSMSSASFSSAPVGIGRLAQASLRLRRSFSFSKSLRRPSRLMTCSSVCWRRSYVVNRAPHSRHARRRRISWPVSRESVTRVSVVPQPGQCMLASRLQRQS